MPHSSRAGVRRGGSLRSFGLLGLSRLRKAAELSQKEVSSLLAGGWGGLRFGAVDAFG